MPADREALRKSVERVKSLPTIPGVVQQLVTMVEGEHTSAEEVGALIATDQVLSAKLLRLVNSAHYGFPGRISTVTHALVLLGFNVVKGLVLSASVVDFMRGGLGGLWEHSCGVSLIAGRLARELEVPDPEEVTVAGLLHDLGKVILSVEMADLVEEIREQQRMQRCPLRQAEEQVLGGLNHADIAGWLAEDWKLPVRLVEPIRLHHAPGQALHAPVATACIHIADALARAHGVGFGGDPYVPQIDPEALRKIGWRWEDLEAFLPGLPEALDEIDFSVFD